MGFWFIIFSNNDEIRYETLLKLFFCGEVGPPRTILHIEAFENRIQQELPHLLGFERALEKVKDTEDAYKYYLLTVKFGIRTYRAYLEWCKEAKSILGKDGD